MKLNSKIYNFLNDLKADPYKHIEKPSLAIAFHYINGYIYSVFEEGQKDFSVDLQQYVEKMYLGYETDSLIKTDMDIAYNHRHWSDIILFYTENEKQAFYTFFDILDKAVTDVTPSRNGESKQNSITDFLNKLKTRPALLVGEKSLMKISYYIKGYLYALREKGYTVDVFEGFNEYVREHYFGYDRYSEFYSLNNTKINTRNWIDIINFFSADEQEAIDSFFELFEKHISAIGY